MPLRATAQLVMTFCYCHSCNRVGRITVVLIGVAVTFGGTGFDFQLDLVAIQADFL
jgi:hypothetical protein